MGEGNKMFESPETSGAFGLPGMAKARQMTFEFTVGDQSDTL